MPLVDPGPHMWPALPTEPLSDTVATIHMWTQMVGKVRLAQSPWVNHSWHVTLYVTTRGLTTSPIPYGDRTFQIDFDFVTHQLLVHGSDGRTAAFALEAEPIAPFYARLMETLRTIDVHVRIHPRPNEVADAVRFDEDTRPRTYNRDHATLFWRVLVQADRVMNRFRARFTGKCSPVHFFWGAPDLAVTRFSGRTAPAHPGGVPNLPDRIAREAYSHEVSSAGFWAGGNGFPPVFYAYAYPEPPGFSAAPVGPSAAIYEQNLREFILPYTAVQQSETPDEALMEFLQSTYEAAARLAGWDRGALERGTDKAP